MMCRQVLPDPNGIEQIYIIKTEPGTEDGNGSGLMVPEYVNKVKQEPPSDDDAGMDAIQTEEATIKDEHVDEIDYSDLQGTAEGIQFACHCGISYRKETLLIEHQQMCDIPENTMDSLCRFCQQMFPSYSEMIRHVQEFHSTSMSETKCIFCPDRFNSAILLVIHEFRHQLPNVLKCEQCDRIFRKESMLQRHMKVHSNQEGFFTCDDCGRSYVHSENLAIHKQVHSGSRPYSCDLCLKSFYCQSTLRHHRMEHFEGQLSNA